MKGSVEIEKREQRVVLAGTYLCLSHRQYCVFSSEYTHFGLNLGRFYLRVICRISSMCLRAPLS